MPKTIKPASNSTSSALPVLYLVDTNILVRQADAASAQHDTALDAVESLRLSGAILFCPVQALMEFWVVATRPADKNGLGFTVKEAEQWLTLFERLYLTLPEASGLYNEWRRLVTTFQAQGKVAHDARFIAAMKVHGSLTHLLTFNGADFKRYAASEGITIVDPAQVPAPPASN